MNEDDIEHLIDSAATPEPDKDVIQTIQQSAASQGLHESSLQPLPNRFFTFGFALAAMVVMAIGIGVFIQYFLGIDATNNSTEDIALVSAVDEFYVIQTNPEQQALIAQECKTFTVSRYTANAALGKHTLGSIEDDSFVLNENDGSSRSVTVKEFNRITKQKLDAECQSYAALSTAGKLDEFHLSRLEDMAHFGLQPAIKILESISNSDSTFRQRAGAIDQKLKKIRRITRMAEWVGTGTVKQRLNAIETLGKFQSPLAAHYLKTLACELDNEDLALACLKTLQRTQDDHAISTFQYIAEQSINKTVRQRATKLSETLLDTLDNE